MKSAKILVVEHEEKSRQAIDEILTIMGHRFEVATSRAEAKELLISNGYSCLLLGHEVPARSGGMPRMQNTEYVLGDAVEAKGAHRIPIIIMSSAMPDVDDEDKLRWAAEMSSRGATTFVQKPFRTRGRTLDRVIRKPLAGQTESIKLRGPSCDLADRPLPAAPVNPPTPSVDPAPPVAPAPAATDPDPWASIPNEPIEIDDFMARFCEHRSKENRQFRKRALLAAARHGTVGLPQLAGSRKTGQANRYLVHGLLAAWQGFIDEGVDLPPVLEQYRTPPA